MELRIPQFDPNMHPREKITALEEYILKCAYVRADTEEALHWCVEAGKKLKAQWDGVEGWQAQLRTSASKTTKEDVDRAKAVISPGLWTSLEECRTLVESLRRQCYRLGGTDYDAASRVYTLISGA